MKRLGSRKNNKKTGGEHRYMRAQNNKQRKIVKHLLAHPNDEQTKKHKLAL